MTQPPFYQVIARRFRPSRFADVIGQEAIVRTLKNAIRMMRLAHAYLFCGSRGTGKTTLARLFAKALNCLNPEGEEPCNRCSMCLEISAGSSLDVLEIDGASHRSIEDIRQINENVVYASSGRYKIYIIDEVHMLTKDAFNALLKTLEEPPARVKFLFATTEPHKIPTTILSRCQRFNLSRIPLEKIIGKLKKITEEIGAQVSEEALALIAEQAEGGMRDAESLLDQVLSFELGEVTLETVQTILGIASSDYYFELDEAGRTGNLAKAFEVSERIFSEGKDLVHFLEGLVKHLRAILLVHLKEGDGLTSVGGFVNGASRHALRYRASAKIYNQLQCVELIAHLLEAAQRIRNCACPRLTLESTLLHLLRSHSTLSIDVLVKRLIELEQSIEEKSDEERGNSEHHLVSVTSVSPTVPLAPSGTSSHLSPAEVVTISRSAFPASASPASEPKGHYQAQELPLGLESALDSMQGIDNIIEKKGGSVPFELVQSPSRLDSTSPIITQVAPQGGVVSQGSTDKIATTEVGLMRPAYVQDTLLQFAAVELDGRLQRY